MQTQEGPIPYEKENSVLAIKLNQKDVEERTIQCQEISFLNGRKTLDSKLIKKWTFEKEQESFDPLTFHACQEFSELFTFITHSFPWKSGKYEVEFQIESQDEFNLVDNQYEFSLTPIQIEELEKNKNNIKQDYLNLLVGQDHDNHKKIDWVWKNPPLYKKH